MAPAGNQTMVPPSKLEHDEEKSGEEETQEQHPSKVVGVRDGGKVLVLVSSFHSNEEECTEVVIKNQKDSVVATQLCSKYKTIKKSQKAKCGKQHVVAAAAQKCTPKPLEAEAAKKGTPNATSGQKRSSPTKTSNGKKATFTKSSSGKKTTAEKKGNASAPITTAKNGSPSSAKKSTAASSCIYF